MGEIKVSVLCMTYNHEKYIRQCLEGFINQQTNFDFEVLINDDASTDSTASIIREYEKKYPDIIKPVYQSENLYSKHYPIIGGVLLPRAKGKYIALCEGDDWWSDTRKLQKQYDSMESHPDSYMCAHNVMRCNEDGTFSGTFQPFEKCKSGVLLPEYVVEFSMGFSFFQTSSYFLRKNIFEEYFSDSPKFKELFPAGDLPIILYFANRGSIVYLEDAMSCYRMNSIGSWSSRVWHPAGDGKTRHLQRMAESILEYDSYTKGRFHKSCKMGAWRQYYLIAINTNAAKDYRYLLNTENISSFLQQPVKSQLSIIGKGYFPRIYHRLRKT